MPFEEIVASFNSVVEAMEGFVTAYGVPGLFFVMVVQSLVPVFFPSDAVVVGAVILGMDPIVTVVVSGLGSTVGGIIAFFIARRGGKRVVRRFVGEKWMVRLEDWFERWGWYVVVFGRAAPFLSSDAIAYAAGITRMTARVFLPLALLGALLRGAILVILGTAVGGLIPFLR